MWSLPAQALEIGLGPHVSSNLPDVRGCGETASNLQTDEEILEIDSALRKWGTWGLKWFSFFNRTPRFDWYVCGSLRIKEKTS